jgi:hypothetical protein
LGHIISEKCIVVDPEKIEAIRGWTTPINVSNVISFMGLVGYYKRFIVGFSNISHPITSLKKKGINSKWTRGCKENLMKERRKKAQVEDNWNCTREHFGDILNFKREHINIKSKEM